MLNPKGEEELSRGNGLETEATPEGHEQRLGDWRERVTYSREKYSYAAGMGSQVDSRSHGSRYIIQVKS